ncbi:WD40-repeat-containing domain protein [Suillus clintonianus]|uniref:WD40-repeat-containing domain protein n=1 Tax=Suillus clintonianus TaxID=1904413 RepID=UPI001B87AFAC|nr:WD40-repeat-containing domain protein [Suillus clintonianus]KAG2115041.1 WD40-repeat-containing domain protein [Suillus clintonianus]
MASGSSTPAQVKGPIPKYKFEGHENTIWDFVFLHDNVHIVSSSEDGTLRKWNCDTGLIVGEPWEGKGGRIYALALSPDGKTIACGREDGSVQRWNTDGEMIGGVLTGHSDSVMSLSWSPSGDDIASGSSDGTVLIRKAKNGVVVGRIRTDLEQGGVYALAYSLSGDRIASGGNKAICIWNTKTGELVIGAIEGLQKYVTSLVWSLDSTKLYSASDNFARVFDSKSGKRLLSHQHDSPLYSVALSPKHNILACVGIDGIAKLWDTESLRPLGQPFGQDRQRLCHVSFSPDGRYLAYSGGNNKLTLWSVKDIAPQLVAPILPQQSDRRSTQQETRPNSPSSLCLDADATGGDNIIEEGNDDPYNNFFPSSCQSLPSEAPGSHIPHLFSVRRLLKVFSRHHPPTDESVPQEASKRSFFARRARSNSPPKPATMKANQPVPEGKVGEGKGEQGDSNRGSTNDPLAAIEEKREQQDKPPTDAQSAPSDDPTHPGDLDRKDDRTFWKRIMRARGKDPSDANIAPAMKRPKVVKVSAVRGFQGYVAMKRVHKTKPLVPSDANSSHLASSSQGVSVHAGPSSHAVVANGAQISQATGGSSSHAVAVNAAQSSQVIGGPSSHASPSHFVTNYHTHHDSDSHSSIEGSCNRFLYRICFPFGRYRNDS